MKALRILTLITSLFSTAAIAAHSAPVMPAVSLTGEKAVAQLKESGQYDSLAAAYEAARHAVRADEAEPDGVLHAQNPGHGLGATFDRHGLQLSVRRHGSEVERLTTRWRLASVGREGAAVEVPAGDALRRDGQRAEIVRAGLGLTEWFVNRPSGLEHGFTLGRRPAGEGALRLDIAIEGDLTPVPSADGQRIELHDAAGAKVLDYDKLRVWDAAGRELAARMERAAAGGLRFRVEDAGARYPLTVDPTFTQQAYLKASNTGAGDNFGSSVAISGDTVAVGAMFEDSSTTGINSTPDDSANNAGAAYVFVRSGSTWTQQAYLKASNPGANNVFGYSVAVSGDTLVVGAFGEKSSTTGINSTPNEEALAAGAAYVFVRSGSTWSQQAYLKASNTGANDGFGNDVAVSKDTVVVGAKYEDSSTTGINSTPDDSANNAGAAYVFVRSGSTWTQQAYLKASNAEAGDRFGASVAVSGNTVAVGAYFEDSSTTGINSAPNELANGAGAAYVFVRSGTNWTQQAYLKASNAGAGDQFGFSVAASGNTVAVGANGEDSGTTNINSTPNESAPDAGAAYVFDLIPATTLTIVNPGAEDPVLAPGTFTRTNPGWQELNTTSDNTGIALGNLAQNPPAPEGNQWFWLDSRSIGGLYQQVGTITADTTYTLKITVGVPFTNSIPRASHFSFGLFAGTNAPPTSPLAVATEADVTAGSGSNQTFSLTFSALTGNPFVGQNLFIVMQITSQEANAHQIFFDDISLTATDAFRITAFRYNRAANTFDLTFTSEGYVEYLIEASTDLQTWPLGGPVTGATGAATTSVTVGPLPPDRLFLRVRRAEEPER